MDMAYLELLERIESAFATDLRDHPIVSLRGGDALDDYKSPPAFEPQRDKVSDEYLQTFPWGVGYLDAPSWRHYLPSLMAYALRHLEQSSLVVDALLSSLRPPDREPPRLASLTAEQELMVTCFLDVLAFSPESVHQDMACQVIEEWWGPGALYRVTAT